jgi:rare lipoprotein A
MEYASMFKLVLALAAMIGTGLFASTSANAAAKWACEGPEYVCGSSKPATSARSNDASEPKASRPAKTAKTKKAKAQETASLKSDDKPRRKARTVTSDDDQPRRKARPARSDDGGGTVLTGAASYYWQPQKLASGGYFNPNAYTAAHKSLPFGTRVRVTNQRNGQSVDVVINDRGPYIAGRIIDLSKAAAGAINMQNAGVVPVSVRILGRG